MNDLNRHKEMNHNSIKFNGDKAKSTIKKQKYISKRIKCEHCDKQFNKRETFDKHFMKIHKDIQNRITNGGKGGPKPLESSERK